MSDTTPLVRLHGASYPQDLILVQGIDILAI